MIDVEHASAEVKALHAAISALSQSLFDAAWHIGCEHPIWEALTVESSPWRRRAGPALLRELGQAWLAAEGWIVWDEHFDRLVWLTNEEWRRMRREHEEVG